MDAEFLRSISGAKIRLRPKSPYFTVLIGYAPLRELPDDAPMPTAAVDGRYLWINRKYWFSLTPGQREFLLAHEVLHLAMGHCWRIGGRAPLRWNWACDFVVDLILLRAGFELIPGVLLDEEYDGMTAEEIYEVLRDVETAAMVRTSGPLGGDVRGGGSLTPEEQKQLETVWRAARAAARTAERMYGHGLHPLGDRIEVMIEDPRLAWESMLWRALSFDHADFQNFDRRLIHDGTYLEDLEDDEGLADVAVCIDTSGSVLQILGKFVGSIKSLASLYGKEIPVYWDDAALVGPIPLSEIDEPIGGGGTSFVPFFEEVSKRDYKHVVYLTDLCGTFPKEAPHAKVLWVVPAGTTIEPPFGQVAKVLLEAA